jgi:hypothetical protein
VERIDTDYLIVGAGAAGMAFADTLLSETDARIVIVDRRDHPGGHWNDAYPFVRLHQPAAFYGVNSRPLGQPIKEAAGLNAGLMDLVSGPEIVGYFGQLMNQRFLPSGRVLYFPMSEMLDDDKFESLLTGTHRRVVVKCKRVDATYADTAVPATHPPKYRVTPEAECVPLNRLAQLRRSHRNYVVVGSGKTGIDACLWLLGHGVAPASIRWIIPRDAWLLDRADIQPGDEFFATTFESIAKQLEVAAAATSLADLFERLASAGLLLRLDERVVPSVYRCATVTKAELEQLRRIEGMVRLGHVRTVEASRIVLERGEIPLAADTLIVDCSASAIPQRPTVPIFAGDRITLQFVRTCQPTFSAAFIAHMESSVSGDDEKNALSAPVCAPHVDTDWLRMLLVTMTNQLRWNQHPEHRQWLAQSRLNSLYHSLGNVQPAETAKVALVQRYRDAIQPAMANLQKLLATIA